MPEASIPTGFGHKENPLSEFRPGFVFLFVRAPNGSKAPIAEARRALCKTTSWRKLRLRLPRFGTPARTLLHGSELDFISAISMRECSFRLLNADDNFVKRRVKY
jgi:hypothetical protein